MLILITLSFASTNILLCKKKAQTYTISRSGLPQPYISM